MYGRSSMYGGGGYGGYGQQQAESVFFAPKQSAQQQQQQPEGPNRLAEIRDFNTTMLESLHSYGDGAYALLMRLAAGLRRLREMVRSGSLSGANARRLAVLALALASVLLTATAGHDAYRRGQRKRLWEAIFMSAGPLAAHASAGTLSLHRASL